MASPAPLAGQIIRASMFTMPYRSWGVLDDDTGVGTAFAATTPTQFTTPNQQVYADRLYRIFVWMLWRCSAADNIITWDLQVDPGTAVFASIRPLRQTNAAASAGASTDTLTGFGLWRPGVDAANARARLVSTRASGAGTITPSTYYWQFEDAGPA